MRQRMSAALLMCRLAALLLVLVGALAGLRTPSAGVDLPQYYMGGLMVLEGHWESLYPEPITDSTENAGYPEASTMKVYYARRAGELGVGDTFRFAQPPPVALALAPLAMLSLPAARVVWLLAMCLCLWGTGVIAGAIYRVLVAGPSLAEGVIVLVAVLLPRAFLSIRLGNLSPFVALCLAAAAWAMVDCRAMTGGLSMAVGALAKYTPGVVLPVAFLRGQYRYCLAFGAVLTAAVLLTVVVGGVAPFREFLLVIAPTQAHPTLNWTNQTVWGALSEVSSPALHDRLTLSAKIVQWLLLPAILVLLAVRRHTLQVPERALAGILILLCWIQIFGPITWAHYCASFIPFTGWIWFVCRGVLCRVLAVLLAGVMFMPWAAMPLPAVIGAPLMKFSLLFGMAALGTIAAVVLLRRIPESRAAVASGGALTP